MTDLDSVLQSRDITLMTKVHVVKAIVFFSSHVWMWELDYKESWSLKNWCFWTVVLEKTLESPLVCKEIKPVNPKGNQPWIFTGRTDAEADAPILWPPDANSWLFRKDPHAGTYWGQEEKGRQRVWWLDGITTQWTWVWANSGRQWRTGKSGMLQSVGSRHLMWTGGLTGKVSDAGKY